ncbi:MAG TPA: CarD family transcriptional regulator [Anaerovoracaceae bacterium]|nr:CarD family transcriptional regulator [Anaerovoracaceae bacterium]
MFAVGDKILYPMHGAGVIQAVEERVILGETRRYYIMRLPYVDMNVMIPVDFGSEIAVRPIISKEEVEKVFLVLREDSTDMSNNWNRRNRDNMDKLKTGDIMEVAEVVRNLIRTDRIKKLSTGEKKMLTNAKQILESELVLAVGFDITTIDSLIEEAV